MEQPEGVWWPFGTRKAFVGPHGRTGGFCLVAGNSAQKTPNPIPTHPLGRPNKPQTPNPPTHFAAAGKKVGTRSWISNAVAAVKFRHSAIFWLGVPKFGIQTTRTLQKKSSISAESSRRDTSKSEVFSVLGALACTHDLLKVRPKCHYGVSFAQHFSLAKAITLANLTMHIYEVWPAGTPKY